MVLSWVRINFKLQGFLACFTNTEMAIDCDVHSRLHSSQPQFKYVNVSFSLLFFCHSGAAHARSTIGKKIW